MSSPEPRRDAGLEVAVAQVARPGGRARWAALVWAAALVALVTVAIAERPAEAAPSPIVAIVVAGPHADPGPLAMPKALPTMRIHGEDGLMGSLVFDLEPARVVVRRWPVGRLPGWTNPTQS